MFSLIFFSPFRGRQKKQFRVTLYAKIVAKRYQYKYHLKMVKLQRTKKNENDNQL